MSTRTVIKGTQYEWTCDHCGAVKTFMADHAPKDWDRVNRGPLLSWMVCGDCLSEFPSWFRNA